MPKKAEQDTLWVISNRVDDRVVLFERDPRHPGGEAFVGGSGPDQVYRTPEVERLLRSGELLEIPEPPDKIDGEPNRKKPVALPLPADAGRADQPGMPVRLGRELDPDLVPEGARTAVLEQQSELPDEVPVPQGVVVPPPPEPQRTQSRQGGSR